MEDFDQDKRRRKSRRKASRRILDERRAGPGRRIWARRAEAEEVAKNLRDGERREGTPRRSGDLRRADERRKGDRRLD